MESKLSGSNRGGKDRGKNRLSTGDHWGGSSQTCSIWGKCNHGTPWSCTKWAGEVSPSGVSAESSVYSMLESASGHHLVQWGLTALFLNWDWLFSVWMGSVFKGSLCKTVGWFLLSCPPLPSPPYNSLQCYKFNSGVEPGQGPFSSWFWPPPDRYFLALCTWFM